MRHRPRQPFHEPISGPVLPRDWGWDMTLCIAATSRRDKALVCVCDLMLSQEWTSFDTQTLKLHQLSQSRRWLMLFAGDPSVASDVGRRAVATLQGNGGEQVTEVVDACERAFRAERERKIEAEVLGAWGLDVSTFLREGRDMFGDEEFARIAYEMRLVKLETEFLAMGFDPDGRPYIFTLNDGKSGTASHRINLGFHAIGSGWVLALGALGTTYNPDLPVDELAYRMFEAKFRGEAAAGVGRKTFAMRLTPDGQQAQLLPGQIEEVRRVWAISGQPPPVPEESRAFIHDSWDRLTWAAPPSP